MLAPPNKRSTPLPPTATDGAGMPLLLAYPAIMLSLVKWLKPLMRKKPPTMMRPMRNKIVKIGMGPPPLGLEVAAMSLAGIIRQGTNHNRNFRRSGREKRPTTNASIGEGHSICSQRGLDEEI